MKQTSTRESTKRKEHFIKRRMKTIPTLAEDPCQQLKSYIVQPREPGTSNKLQSELKLTSRKCLNRA